LLIHEQLSDQTKIALIILRTTPDERSGTRLQLAPAGHHSISASDAPCCPSRRPFFRAAPFRLPRAEKGILAKNKGCLKNSPLRFCKHISREEQEVETRQQKNSHKTSSETRHISTSSDFPKSQYLESWLIQCEKNSINAIS
jgi:hypothetical protein